MEKFVHSKDVTETLEAGAGIMVEVDTVAIPDGFGMFGFYTKQTEYLWALCMTSTSLSAFRGKEN